MRKALLDGESIFQAANVIEDLKDENPINISNNQVDALDNVVTALLLWDEIYVFEERLNSHYIDGVEYFKQYGNQFKTTVEFDPFDMDFNVFKEAHDFVSEMMESKPNLLNEIRNSAEKYMGMHADPFLAFEIRRAMTYYLLADRYDLDYIPSIQRRVILQKEEFNTFYLRKDIIRRIDKDLLEYYEELKKEIPETRIAYSAPVLLDYALKDCGFEDLIPKLFELRNEPRFVKFRAEMEALEESVADGNMKRLKEYFKSMTKLMQSTMNEIDAERKIEITLSFPPSISLEVALPGKRAVRSVLLKELTEYGIQNRRSKFDANPYFRKKKG